METIVFSTRREIREYISRTEEGLLPKLNTIDEFISKAIVVEGRVFVDSGARAIYLYRAVESIDIEKLGFSKNFISFISDSDFIFRLFEEMFAEKTGFDELVDDVLSSLSLSDIYSDYEEHLDILKRVYERYSQILESEGLTDRVVMSDFKLNRGFIDELDKIRIHLDGFPSRFELSLYEKIGEKIELRLTTSPFNRKVLQRLKIDTISDKILLYSPAKKEILESQSLSPVNINSIEVASFSQRVDQCGWILAKIDEYVSNGADPDKIAVILPDEEFAEYLRLFDTKRNFNYAMGIPFAQSNYYRTLSELYDAMSGKREYLMDKISKSAFYKDFQNIDSFESFINFVISLEMNSSEREMVEQELFIFSRFSYLLENSDRMDLLHSWLSRLGELSMDDVGGGKITVMGVLESRGVEFDAVIIPDFNEGVVPHVTQKDLFLSSTIREACGMPTRRDKENLQKHYYYSLLRNSKRAAISYISNEEQTVSRFLIEMGIKECNEPKSEIYRPIIAPEREEWDSLAEISDRNIFVAERRFTPTRLKDALECRRRVYYKYLLSIRPDEEEGDAAVGSVIHKALEESVKEKERLHNADEYFSMILSKVYPSLGGALDRFRFTVEWEERLKRFCQRDFETMKKATQIKIEEFCSLVFSEFELSFKVDRVDLSDNRIVLIDYKTGRNIAEKAKKDENDFQLAFYYLWAKENYPEYEIEPVYEALKDEKRVTIDIETKVKALEEILSSLPLDESIPYPKTDEIGFCKYCDYVITCERDI